MMDKTDKQQKEYVNSTNEIFGDECLALGVESINRNYSSLHVFCLLILQVTKWGRQVNELKKAGLNLKNEKPISILKACLPGLIGATFLGVIAIYLAPRDFLPKI